MKLLWLSAEGRGCFYHYLLSARFDGNLSPIANKSRRVASVRKIVSRIAGVAFVLTLTVGLKPIVAHAKVDCAKVMSELSSGKKAADVASDLKISTSSVYRCRRKARAAAKSSPAAGAQTSPMASPSPAH